MSLKTQAPLTLPGMLSTAGHCDQSSAAIFVSFGASIEEIMEWFDVSREQIVTVLAFAARSLDAPIPYSRQAMVDAHSMAGWETTCSERHRSD